MTEKVTALMSSDKNIRPLQFTCIWHYILRSFFYIGSVTEDKRMSAVMTRDDFVYLFRKDQQNEYQFSAINEAIKQSSWENIKF